MKLSLPNMFIIATILILVSFSANCYFIYYVYRYDLLISLPSFPFLFSAHGFNFIFNLIILIFLDELEKINKLRYIKLSLVIGIVVNLIFYLFNYNLVGKLGLISLFSAVCSIAGALIFLYCIKKYQGRD